MPNKSRSRIVDHGAGKGDKSRVTDEHAYQENLADVTFSGVPASQDPAFEKRGGKLIKTYGPKEPEVFERFNTKPIIH